MMRRMTKFIDKGIADLRAATLAPVNFTVAPELTLQSDNVDLIKENMKEIVKEMKKQAKVAEADNSRNLHLSEIFDAFSKAYAEKNAQSPTSSCLRDASAFVQRLNDLMAKLEENVQQVLCTTMETFVTDGLKPALEQKRQYDREAMDYDNMITKHKSLKKSGKATPQKEKESEQQLAETREEYLQTEKATVELMKQAAAKGEMLTIVKLVEYWDSVNTFFKDGVRFLETMQPKIERYRRHLRELAKPALSTQAKVFKQPIEKLCGRENRRVPQIVVACCAYLSVHGLETQGIFRVSPTKDSLDELKREIDQGRTYNFEDVTNPHVISGLLKAFFRETPEPIFTFEKYAKFMEASKLPTTEAQVSAIAKLLQTLPSNSYKSLQHVSRLCVLIDSHKEENKMNASNLATVLTPNLLYTTTMDPLTMVQEMEQANKIYTLIVENYNEMFPEDDLEQDALSPEALEPRSNSNPASPRAAAIKAPSAASTASAASAGSLVSNSTTSTGPAPKLHGKSASVSENLGVTLSSSAPSLPSPLASSGDGEDSGVAGEGSEASVTSTSTKKKRSKISSSLKFDASGSPSSASSLNVDSDIDGESSKKRTPRSSRSKKGISRSESIGPNSPGRDSPSILSPAGSSTSSASNTGSVSPRSGGSRAMAAVEGLRRTVSHRQTLGESKDSKDGQDASTPERSPRGEKSPRSERSSTISITSPPKDDSQSPTSTSLDIKKNRKKKQISVTSDSSNTPRDGESSEIDSPKSPKTPKTPTVTSESIPPTTPEQETTPTTAPLAEETTIAKFETEPTSVPTEPTSEPTPDSHTQNESSDSTKDSSESTDEAKIPEPINLSVEAASSDSSVVEKHANEVEKVDDAKEPKDEATEAGTTESSVSESTSAVETSVKEESPLPAPVAVSSATAALLESEKSSGEDVSKGEVQEDESLKSVKSDSKVDENALQSSMERDESSESILEDLGILVKSPSMTGEDEEIPDLLPEPVEHVSLLLDASIQSLNDALVGFTKTGTKVSLMADEGVSALSQSTRELAMAARTLSTSSGVLISNYPESEESIEASMQSLQSLLRPVVIAVKEVTTTFGAESVDETNAVEALNGLQSATHEYASEVYGFMNHLSSASSQQLLLAAQGALKRATAVVAPTIRAVLSTGLDEPLESVKSQMVKEVNSVLVFSALITAQLTSKNLVEPLDSLVASIPDLMRAFWNGVASAQDNPDPQEAGQTLVQDAKELIGALRGLENCLGDCVSTSASSSVMSLSSPRGKVSDADMQQTLVHTLDELTSRVEYGATSDLSTRLLLASAKRTIKAFIARTREFGTQLTSQSNHSITAYQTYVEAVNKMLTYIKYHRIDGIDSSPTPAGYASAVLLGINHARVLAVLNATLNEDTGSTNDQTNQSPRSLLLSHLLRITHHINLAIFG